MTTPTLLEFFLVTWAASATYLMLYYKRISLKTTDMLIATIEDPVVLATAREALALLRTQTTRRR